MPEDHIYFRPAVETDLPYIFDLYAAAVGTEGCTWDEEYPNRDILAGDLARHALFCMEEHGAVIGAISIDDDPLADALEAWNREMVPAAEIARVVVAESCRGRGIAPRMFLELEKILAQRGYRSVHYLVSADNRKALHAYDTLGYRHVGDSDLYGHNWLCYEKFL